MENEDKTMDDLLAVSYAGVKALPGGRLRGPVVLFSDATAPDLSGDFFTKGTDLGIAERLPVYYQHGFDAVLKTQRLAIATLSEAEEDEAFGIWAEYQLDLESRYHRFLHDRAAEGKMGHSSGALAHLVVRERMANETYHVKAWPLGELSLTPEPAEPRMVGQVRPVKAMISLYAPLDLSTVEQQPVTEPVKTAMSEQQTPAAAPEPQAPAIVPATPADVAAVNASLGQTLAELAQEIAAIKATVEARPPLRGQSQIPGAPAYLKYGLGDSETKALAYWIKTGDVRAMQHYEAGPDREWGMTMAPGMSAIALKASNDTSISAGADPGSNTVPTGHFNGIIARRDESNLAPRLGIRVIPGQGTTVNVPVDNEDDGEFVSTAELATNDRDAPDLNTVAMTLGKYTKMIELTDEVMDDEESMLLAFIEDFVGRGMAKTHNNLILTEVGNSGTAFKTFAASNAIASGEPEDLLADDDLGDYMDDSGSFAWVGRNSTHNAIISLLGNNRIYETTPIGGGAAFGAVRSLLGFPYYTSNKADAIAATGGTGNKTLYVGNWNFVGVRNAPEFRVLRDPFSNARAGVLRLHYYFRTIYKVLQSEAVGYGKMAAT